MNANTLRRRGDVIAELDGQVRGAPRQPEHYGETLMYPLEVMGVGRVPAINRK